MNWHYFSTNAHFYVSYSYRAGISCKETKKSVFEIISHLPTKHHTNYRGAFMGPGDPGVSPMSKMKQIESRVTNELVHYQLQYRTQLMIVVCVSDIKFFT